MSTLIRISITFNGTNKTVSKIPKEYLWLRSLKVKNIKYKEIDNFEESCGYFLDKDWLDNLALYTQIVIKKSQINYQHGRILYSLLMKYLNQNNDKINVLETGTARGFSSICMSKAILDLGPKSLIIKEQNIWKT